MHVSSLTHTHALIHTRTPAHKHAHALVHVHVRQLEHVHVHIKQKCLRKYFMHIYTHKDTLINMHQQSDNL